MIQACIFDLDGTLLDSEILWVEATEQFMRDRGGPVTHAEAVRLVYGRSWHDIYPELASRMSPPALTREDMEQIIHPLYLALREKRDVRIPGSIALLKRLADTHAICIVSGSSRPQVEQGIGLMNIGRFVRFYLGAEDYSPGKPAPACYLLAARRLAAAPRECVVFEDSEAGVRAAKAAGMWCVALARNGAPPQDFSEADRVVAELSDFDVSVFDCPACPRAVD